MPKQSVNQNQPQYVCGNLLKRVRLQAGISQQTLAECAHTSQAAISQIENNQTSPSLDTLNRLLSVMDQTLQLEVLALDQRPPGGGNRTVRELRETYEQLTPDEWLEEAVYLSEIATDLAAQNESRDDT